MVFEFLKKIFKPKGPLDGIDYEKLKEYRVRIHQKINDLNNQIDALGKEINDIWDKAKDSKDPSVRLAFAEMINTLEHERKSRLNILSKKQKDLRIVNGFILKFEEKELKKISPLPEGSQQNLEDLIEALKASDEEDKMIREILDEGLEPSSPQIDDNIQNILKALEATEKDTYSVRTQEPQISKEKKELE
jgi:hypothetical protein